MRACGSTFALRRHEGVNARDRRRHDGWHIRSSPRSTLNNARPQRRQRIRPWNGRLARSGLTPGCRGRVLSGSDEATRQPATNTRCFSDLADGHDIDRFDRLCISHLLAGRANGHVPWCGRQEQPRVSRQSVGAPAPKDPYGWSHWGRSSPTPECRRRATTTGSYIGGGTWPPYASLRTAACYMTPRPPANSPSSRKADLAMLPRPPGR